MAGYFYRYVHTGTYYGIRLSATMHYQAVDETTLMSTADLDLVNADMATFFSSNAAYFASTCQWTIGSRVLRYDITSLATPPVIEPVTPIAATSGSGGDALATSSAMVLTWRTAKAGPRYRGRTFLGVMAKVIAASGQWTPSAAATQATRGQLLLTNLAANARPGGLVLFSKKYGSLEDITSATCDINIDNLSSRKF